MNVSVWCTRIIRTGFILIFTLVPLLLTPWNYELFEYNKMMVTYALTVVIVGAWIVKMINDREIRIAKTPLDIPIVLFFVSQLVSALFSIDHHVSWFGYYSRFNGGMWSVISYILLYYAFVSNSITVLPLLMGTLASGAVVAIYGVLERLGIDKNLWVQDVQNRVFSTLGQPNWLGAYLVALIPIAFGFSLKKVYWAGLSVLFFAVLLFTRSRSGLVGFAAADAFFWGLVFLTSSVIPGLTRDPVLTKTGFRLGGRNDNWNKLIIPFVICHVSFVMLVFFNGTSIDSIDRWLRPTPSTTPTTEATPSAYTAPLLEFGGTESGTIRKYVWQGAVTAWKSSVKTMLVGTGTETFAFAFYQYRPKEHNLTSEWDFLYNKAHNEYLNYLTTTGVFGLGSYLLIIGAFIIWFIKISKSEFLISKQIQSSKSKLDQLGQLEISTLHIALFAGWVSILVTNFFGFSVVILQLFFFLFPAMILANGKTYYNKSLRLPRFTMWVASVISIILLVILGRMWWADILFAKGYRGARLGQYEASRAALSQAIAINPTEPLYHDEASSTLSILTSLAIENRDATTAAALARESIKENDAAIRTEPANVNFWKTRTKILYSFTPFDPTFIKAAITALEKAHTLSPNDPKILYNLAVLYGQDGNTDRAIELLKTAVTIKSNYRDAYWALHVFYNQIKQSELAKSIITGYLTNVDPNDNEFKQALTQ